MSGKPYLLETDEYTQGTVGGGGRDEVGAARIIDISDERKPKVVSNLRLQVNQPADHAKAANDPGAISPVQGYAAHYCDVSTPKDPTVVACSFIASGLRVFDISDLDQAEGDRLLRAGGAEPGRERVGRQRLRDVQARGGAEPPRGLVQRRRDAASTTCA